MSVVGRSEVTGIRGRRRGWGPRSWWWPARRSHTTVSDLRDTAGERFRCNTLGLRLLSLIIHILIVVSKGKLSGITAHRSARVEREKEMKAASKFSPNFAKKKKREFPQRKIKVVYIQWVQTCGNRAVFNYTTGTSDGLDVVCNYTVITFLNSRFTWSWCDYTRINKFIPPEIKSISFSKSECGDNCVEAGHIVHYKWSLKPLIITLKHGIIDLVACFALCTVLLLVGLKTHQVNVLKVWKWPFPWSTLSRVLPTCLCKKPAAVTFNI